MFGQLAVSEELVCISRQGISSFAPASQSCLLSVIPGSYIRKTGEFPIEIRSCINGSQVQDKEPNEFDATEQTSLSRSPLAALAVPLHFLQKQDFNMCYSVYSSGLLTDWVLSSLLILAYDGPMLFVLTYLSSSAKILFIHAPNTLLSFPSKDVANTLPHFRAHQSLTPRYSYQPHSQHGVHHAHMCIRFL